jgi:hypothetical protein
MWRAGLSIAKFCSDSDKAIHKLSERHPNYSIAETVEKVNLIKGPYLCNKFDEFNPKICKKCKHWKKIKSPITLGNVVIEATEEDNTVRACLCGAWQYGRWTRLCNTQRLGLTSYRQERPQTRLTGNLVGLAIVWKHSY